MGDLWSFLTSQSLLRGIVGFVLVFFIPGFAWTLVFFRQINVLERIALAFALSIAVVTLSILISNRLLGISITGLNSVFIIIVISLVPLGIYYFKRLTRKRTGEGKSA